MSLGVGRWTRPELKRDNKNKVQFRVARRFLFILEARNFARLVEALICVLDSSEYMLFYLLCCSTRYKAHLATLGCN